jgi:hypothetical protein
MAGDTAVRSLLEKMAECASNAYLGILERYSSGMSTIFCCGNCNFPGQCLIRVVLSKNL